MSDEEKKEIEYFKRRIANKKTAYTSIYFKIEKLDALINLIEKQSKEIEELKAFKIEDENIYLQFGEIFSNKRWEDKIKAKIEEVKDGTFDAEIVLQSLLEKE